MRRIVLNGLKPNEFTINGPKVVIPPLGILAKSVTVETMRERLGY